MVKEVVMLIFDGSEYISSLRFFKYQFQVLFWFSLYLLKLK